MIRKQSYLLLELLIAFAIVALLLSPLIQPLFHSLKTESSALETIQLRRRADLCFADLKAQLYSGSIEEKMIPTEKGEKRLYRSGPFKRFKETLSLQLKREKTGKEKEHYSLFLVEITYASTRGSSKKTKFHYNVFLKEI